SATGTETTSSLTSPGLGGALPAAASLLVSVLPILTSWLSKGEHVGPCAGIEERDLEGPVAGRAALSNQLVHPGIGDDPVYPLVDVDSPRPVHGLAIDHHQEADGLVRFRPQHE